MKKSDYFYSILLLGMLALITYCFINYFGIMIALIAISSVLNFIVFLVQTGTAKRPAVDQEYSNNTIDFYTAGEKTTYYQTQHEVEQLKQAN